MDRGRLVSGFLLVISARVTMETSIIAVIDSRIAELNPYIENMMTSTLSLATDMRVIISHNDNALETFTSVCEEVKKGAAILVDMTSPTVGPLLASFARANGLVLLTIMDDSILHRPSMAGGYRVSIEPPGTAILPVIADIVQFDNLTNVAVLYDDSFNLQWMPRRVISGVLSHHIYIELNRSAISATLGRLNDLKTENIFIIGNAANADFILAQASQTSGQLKHLTGEDVNWLVITKDQQLMCDGCRTKMRTLILEGDYWFEHMIIYKSYMRRKFDRGFDNDDITVDEAFMFDLLSILNDRLPESPALVTPTDCYSDTTISNHTAASAESIVDSLINVSYEGVFGPIVSGPTTPHIRQKIRLSIRREEFQHGRTVSSEALGFWTQEAGLNVSHGSLVRAKSKKTYRVVVVPQYEPFIYRHVYTVNGTETYSYTGFCKDLFDKIALKLDFTYDIYESPDTYFGSLNDNGTWNGAINELLLSNADIAIGPISVMSERENVIDFTVPFHEPVGLTILMRKPKFEYSLHRFLSVLDIEVWGCIFASYFLFSILMWLFDKFSPYSYQNNPDDSTGPEKRIFTLKEGIWFCMTSLTPQGGGEAPKAVSGRLVAAVWWLYGFLLIAFYTANLAAFLTVTRLETPITSLDDLSKQQNVKYGPMEGTSAKVYFERMAQIEEQFYRIWKDMSLNDSLSPVQRAKLAVWDYPVSEQFTKLMDNMYIPTTFTEALMSVKRGEFAFIDDATRNKYQTLIDCDVEQIGEEFSRKPFAFAVVQGSPLRAQMSNVILELANDRVVEELSNTWWQSNSLKKECPSIEDESDGISFKNIGGVFLVIGIGTGLSLIAFVAELYYYKLKPHKDNKSYKVDKKNNTVNGRLGNTGHIGRNSALNISESQLSCVTSQTTTSFIDNDETQNGCATFSNNSARLNNGSPPVFSLSSGFDDFGESPINRRSSVISDRTNRRLELTEHL